MLSITPAGELAVGETYTVEIEYDEEVFTDLTAPFITLVNVGTSLPLEVSGTRVRFQLTVPEVSILRVRAVWWCEA